MCCHAFDTSHHSSPFHTPPLPLAAWWWEDHNASYTLNATLHPGPDGVLSPTVVFRPRTQQYIVAFGYRDSVTTSIAPSTTTANIDVWGLSGGNDLLYQVWSQIVPVNTPPPGRMYSTGIYDPVSDQLVLYGGAICNNASSLNDCSMSGGLPPGQPAYYTFQNSTLVLELSNPAGPTWRVYDATFQRDPSQVGEMGGVVVCMCCAWVGGIKSSQVCANARIDTSALPDSPQHPISRRGVGVYVPGVGVYVRGGGERGVCCGLMLGLRRFLEQAVVPRGMRRRSAEQRVAGFSDDAVLAVAWVWGGSGVLDAAWCGAAGGGVRTSDGQSDGSHFCRMRCSALPLLRLRARSYPAHA